MKEFLILKLQGPMQAWGEHTFEGKRPSGNFPTRSGLLGLLGACLGIPRNDQERFQQLADSVQFAVLAEERSQTTRSGTSRRLTPVKQTDYHTIRDAREDYRGLKSHETIQTWREYLYDSAFTVAVWNNEGSAVSLEELVQAVKAPIFTPYLGRRSCPLSKPLFVSLITAGDAHQALRRFHPLPAIIYSEQPGEVRSIRVRDVPLIWQKRQFSTRNIYMHGGTDVPE